MEEDIIPLPPARLAIAPRDTSASPSSDQTEHTPGETARGKRGRGDGQEEGPPQDANSSAQLSESAEAENDSAEDEAGPKH